MRPLGFERNNHNITKQVVTDWTSEYNRVARLTASEVRRSGSSDFCAVPSPFVGPRPCRPTRAAGGGWEGT